jgi:peroxiredoxin
VSNHILGGYSSEVPPLPIPNREVKLAYADGTLEGAIEAGAAKGRWIQLALARGGQWQPVDSARINDQGRFSFSRSHAVPGQYQLALSDTDLFVLILDGQEPVVELHFDHLPMDAHAQVAVSQENQLLQEYRLATAQAQAIRMAAARQRAQLQPTDSLQLTHLDSIVARADRVERLHVQDLVQQAPGSLFAKTVGADLALKQTIRRSPMDVARVFRFNDPELMHSPVYDQAVLHFLQNLNAVDESQFSNAADTLMRLASGNADCEGYMLEHLIDLFATYGPEKALQHMVDGYYAPRSHQADLEPELQAKVEQLMQVSVGRTGPDVPLNDHGDTLHLAELAARNRYTALFFYSSTCSHCHDQMPTLKRDYELFHGRGFDVLGIALDADSADFRASISENAIPWKCYSHFRGWGEPAAKAYQVKGTPTFFLLDPELKIVAKPDDAEKLRAVLRELMK